MADLFMPLTSRDWSSVKYKYIPPSENKAEESGFGRFSGAGGAEVFAPEAGLLVAAGDGTFILQVIDGETSREWFFLSKLLFDFKTDQVIRAGTKLGLSEGPLLLALVTGPKGGKLEPINPAKYLIDNKARFVDKVGPGVEGRRVRDNDAAELALRRGEDPAKTSSVAPRDNASTNPGAELTTTTPAPKKEFTAPQVVGIAVGFTLLGGAIMWGMKR